jgi:S1-C subfamily serine protease
MAFRQNELKMNTNHYWELAENYCSGRLNDTEKTAVDNRLLSDADFAADFNECLHLIQSLHQSGSQKQFRNTLVSIEESTKQKASNWKVRTIPLRTHYLRTAGIAASIAILTTLSTVWIENHNQKTQTSQYRLLRRELETIKRSQKAIIKNINSANQPAQPQANFSGTGFALSNDGYFVTSYHVTEGADSVYIQNRDGETFKANMVSFDEKADVALLKVDNKSFRFAKKEVPYNFASSKKSLGANVFTLGYPQDEIVYSEGYISSKNGYEGDSMQYRLELPASPGQSGSPVMDKQGNVIAIVTGKENNTEGTTYAVSSNAVYTLVQKLPKEEKLKLPKGNRFSRMSREQQVENLEYYTCQVRVFKN